MALESMKACPFCGSSNVSVDEEEADDGQPGPWWVGCEDCGGMGPASATGEAEAISDWNQRVAAGDS